MSTNKLLLIFGGLGVSVLLAVAVDHWSTADSAVPNIFDWKYDDKIVDPPPHIILGHPVELKGWLNAHRDELLARFEAVSSLSPLQLKATSERTISVGTASLALTRLVGDWPEGHLLNGHEVGAFIAQPTTIDPENPIVIAVHGHEINNRGEPPNILWDKKLWPAQIAAAGYIVITPSHLLYKQLATLYDEHDHHSVWVRAVWDIVSSIQSLPVGSRFAVVGLSSGGLTASLLAAWQPDIACVINSGHFAPLDFMRRNYRSQNGINQWNLSNVYSYAPFYMLTGDRRTLFQAGRADTWYPDAKPFPAHGRFAGTPRDVMTSGMFGPLFVAMQSAKALGGLVDVQIHSAGHEFHVGSALDFLEKCGP